MGAMCSLDFKAMRFQLEWHILFKGFLFVSEYLGTVDRNDHCLVVYDVLLDNHTKMYIWIEYKYLQWQHNYCTYSIDIIDYRRFRGWYVIYCIYGYTRSVYINKYNESFLEMSIS